MSLADPPASNLLASFLASATIDESIVDWMVIPLGPYMPYMVVDMFFGEFLRFKFVT